MDFSESITALAERAKKLKENLKTEEATKTALVLPFINALGYDIFNPLEVVPEFVADIAGKKGEKVDYAIMQDGKPIMIIECKSCGVCLNDIKRDQLHRYFLTLDSCIGILTDGLRYQFFSTAEDEKNMDVTPFMEFDLENVDPTLLPELRKLCKGKFDLKSTLDTVNELKANRQIKHLLAKNLAAPEEGFVYYFMKEANVRATAKAVEQYLAYMKRAFTEFVDEQIDSRLKNALAASSKHEEAPAPEAAEPEKAKPETTEQEWQAFYLIKSLLMGTIDSNRITIRDGVTFCNILLDNSIQKPLVRLFFNNPEKLYIELIGENKEKIPHPISKIDDILAHAEAIRATARMYEAGKGQ